MLILPKEHPHLFLGQIDAALGFYHDHQVEMDEAIRRGQDHVDEMRRQPVDSPIRKKLHSLGKLA